jgi:hypothetical protein
MLTPERHQISGKTIGIKMNDQATYEILVMGALSERWAEWFQGMTIQQEIQNGAHVTEICGLVQDQSSLIGMLQTLINLGLPILLVKRLTWL